MAADSLTVSLARPSLMAWLAGRGSAVGEFFQCMGTPVPGGLSLDQVDALKSRFRRIRFATKPVAIDATVMRTTVMRSWGAGAEAIVSNYDDLAFERMRSASNIGAAEVEASTGRSQDRTDDDSVICRAVATDAALGPPR